MKIVIKLDAQELTVKEVQNISDSIRDIIEKIPLESDTGAEWDISYSGDDGAPKSCFGGVNYSDST